MGNKLPTAPISITTMVFKLPSTSGAGTGEGATDLLVLEHDTVNGKRKVAINGTVYLEQTVSRGLENNATLSAAVRTDILPRGIGLDWIGLDWYCSFHRLCLCLLLFVFI